MARRSASIEIITTINARTGSPSYVEGLQAIDRRFEENQEAIYDLARALQLHWEREYGSRLIESRDEWIRKGSVVGRAGILLPAIYGAIPYLPGAKLVRHFGLIRLLIVAETTGALGALSGQLTHGLLHQAIPLSPAHILHLGLADSEWSQLEDKHLVREIFKDLGLFYASATGVSKISARLLSKSGGVGGVKAKLLEVAAVLFVQYVGGRLLDAGFEAWDYHRLHSELAQSLVRLNDPTLRQDVVLFYQEADHAASLAVRLETTVNRPLQAAAVSYNQKLNHLSTRARPGSPDYLAASTELSNHLKEKVDTFLNKPRKLESDQLLREVTESLKSAQKPFVMFQVELLETLIERSQWLRPLVSQEGAL